MTPHMFDVSNIDVWKIKMSMYLKTIDLHVFLAATKKSYLSNIKHIEANAQALEALRCTLNKEYLCIVSHCNSASAVWRNLVENPSNIATWSKGMTHLRYIWNLN